MWLQLSLVSRKCQVTVATEREFFKGSFLVLEGFLAGQTSDPKPWSQYNHVPYPQTRIPRPSWYPVELNLEIENNREKSIKVRPANQDPDQPHLDGFPANEIDLNFWLYNKGGVLGLDMADHGGHKPASLRSSSTERVCHQIVNHPIPKLWYKWYW